MNHFFYYYYIIYIYYILFAIVTKYCSKQSRAHECSNDSENGKLVTCLTHPRSKWVEEALCVSMCVCCMVPVLIICCSVWFVSQNIFLFFHIVDDQIQKSAVIGSQALGSGGKWRFFFVFFFLIVWAHAGMYVYVHGAVIRLQAGCSSSLALFLSLWRVSEGVCIRPLPWRYRPRMQPTRALSGLYPAPPPRSGPQRWPSESPVQYHATSAGPPTHRPNTTKCCLHLSRNNTLTHMFILRSKPKKLHLDLYKIFILSFYSS